tara:strand:+ start:1023 stop:1823 length:801 start_codon:yes stop_codon:yes gene_type:complete
MKEKKEMAQLPKMNLFVDAFNSDTSFLTEEELGMYLRLIFYAWTHNAELPKNKDILYNLPKVKNDALVDKILKLFFTEEEDCYIQKRLLKEYNYAMEVSNKASQSAKSRYANAERTQSERTATITKTNTITNTKGIYIEQFNEFWELVTNKVSKGQALKNYIKLDEDWIDKPKELAEMYNEYYLSQEDKKFAKQPAFWLSAEKYLDERPKEPTAADTETLKLKNWVKPFKEATTFAKDYAKKNKGLVNKMVEKGMITEEDVENLYL